MRLPACLLLACLAPAVAVDTSAAVSSAVSWVMARQAEDYGWGPETSKAVIAVSLANASALFGTERQLTLKQLEINFLVDMWGRKEFPLTTGRIAEYVLAFTSLCHDVTSFHGRDLTTTLRHHHGVLDYESALVVLATCSAGVKVRRRLYSKLLSVADDQSDLHGTDTLALAVLALRCVADDGQPGVEQHLTGPLAALVQRQKADGGFGNFHSSLLAVQALRSGQGADWNETAAILYLASHEQPDGGFGNLFDTTQVLPVLAGRSLLDVRNTPCHSAPPPPPTTMAPTSPAAPVSPPETLSPPVNFTFWLWVGSDVNTTHSQQMMVPANTSLFDAMKLAAERNSHYVFAATVWPNGHYIHTIGGFHEQKVGYMFWLLYRLQSPPDPAAPPPNTSLSATGVDDVYPKNGEHILFWYKKI